MNHFITTNLSRIGAVGLLMTGIMTPLTASALSYSNPGAAVSSGDTPFSLSCEFSNYAAVGTHSINEKMNALPANQNFSFTGSDVQNGDGNLSGYVFGDTGSRRDWRMETGMPGSPIYRFTHFKQSDQIIANIDIINGGEFPRPDIDAKGPAATKAKEKAATTFGTREPVKSSASKAEKTAFAAQTIVLAAAVKAATAAEKAAIADDEAARADVATEVPDMHSIKGTCRWTAGS